MRRLIVSEFLSLDGVMQGPGGPEEDASGGFTHGGWTVNYWDDLMNEYMDEVMGKPFDLLLGRKTYDIFAAYWPTAPEETGSKPLNDATKFVASRGRPSLSWSESILLEGDAGDAVTSLKATDGPDLLVFGSGDLVQTLLQRSLIDEFRLLIFPVVIGTGKRLFASGTVPSALRLADGKVSTTGVVICIYEPAGEIVTGTLGAE